LTRARTERIASAPISAANWSTVVSETVRKAANAASIAKIKSGAIQWAVDQQPYLQGYEAVDALWLYLTNGNALGGGQIVLTGPSFVDASNVAAVAKYAARGTR
jgi:simple sugar transport system substrate-binding protein